MKFSRNPRIEKLETHTLRSALTSGLRTGFKAQRVSALAAKGRAAVEPLEGRMLLSGSVVHLPMAAPSHATAHHVNVNLHATSRKPHSQKAGGVHAHSGSSPAKRMLVHPLSQVLGPAGNNSSPVATALTPSQIQQAYGFNNILLPSGAPATGAGETIALVEAFHDPNIQSDLHTFDQQYFGGVDPSFNQVNLGSSTNVDTTGGWEFEEAMDVEWAHAMAPQANIDVVEATSNGNMNPAIDEAVSLGAQVVSMSWSGPENTSETSWDSHFAVPNVTFVASSGDGGAPAVYPAASPDVVAVGGTSLALDANGNWSSEVGWFNSTGGISLYESRPAFQPTTYTNGPITGIPLTKRGNPDVAYDASNTSGISVYDSYPDSNPSRYSGTLTGWHSAAGTSCGAPQWAALIALADQGRAQSGLAPLGSAQTLSTLYASPGDFHDITSGTSLGNPNYTAGTGYDLVTGLGSPQAPLIVSSLIGLAPTSAPATPTGLSATPADGKVSLLWNASSGATSWNIYRSTDGISFMPYASETGTSFVDSGLTDGNSYWYEVTAVNSVGESSPSAAVSAMPQVPPAPPTLPSASASYTTVESTTNFAMMLDWDASTGASSYTVLRSSTSGSGYAVIASGISGTSYVDSTVYAGQTYYYVIESVNSAGAQSAYSVQVSGTAFPAAPTNLTATAGNAQTALSWGASAGAISYNVLRSTINGSGYSLIASGIKTTSFTDSKLTIGTTYYYVVQAVDSGGASLDSNQASATAKHGK